MKLNISLEDWSFAALLGHSRRLSNEPIRTKSRDRGYYKNIRNDLVGSLGEILAFKYLARYMSANQQIVHLESMFGLGGGIMHTSADLFLDLHPKKLRLDIKTFDCEPNKKFFAINSRKHNKLSGNCDGYLCFALPIYSTIGKMSNIINHSSVYDWECSSLGNYGDPSFNLPLPALFDDYIRNIDLSSLRGLPRYTRDELRLELRKEKTRKKFLSLCPNAAIHLSC